MKENVKQPKSGASRQSFHLQFITTPTADTPGTTFLLHFDNRKYVFGRFNEGLQRACIQRGVSLRKVRNLFLTGQTHWGNNGGLIGMILTMAEVQQSERESDDSDRRPRLNIHGGPLLLHTMACARRFVFRTSMPLTVHENPVGAWTTEPTYVDENIRVWALDLSGLQISLRGSSLGHGSHSSDDSSTESQMLPFTASARVAPEVVEMEQNLRRAIVKDMFDSEWRKDRLIETTFKDVKMPATVWLRDAQTKQLQNYNCVDMQSAPGISPNQLVLVRNPWPASLVGQLPVASNLPGNSDFGYIVKGHPQRGVFDPQKAKELGVKPGPDYGKLTSGETVTSSSGQLVTPEMVLGPTKPGKGFAVFDGTGCTWKYLEQQLKSAPPDLLEGLETIIWIVEDSNHLPEVLRLIDSIHGVKHILANRHLSGDYLALDSSALSSARLSQISSRHFPIPLHSNETGNVPDKDVKSLMAQILNNQVSNCCTARRGLKVRIEPSHVIDDSDVPSPTCITALDHQHHDAQNGLTQLVDNTAATRGNGLTEPEIITLGTGSAIPSKYRNVSATLLRMPGKLGNYLFDCGENTLGQMRRVFSTTELDEILLNLKAIWISHLHADHHLGTITILRAVNNRRKHCRREGLPAPKPTCVMSEENMIDFLDEYSSVEPFLNDSEWLKLIVCSPSEGSTLHGVPVNFAEHDLPFKQVQTARVSHCHGAQAVSITFENGFKFSYSGDCRPSETFAEIGAGSDVLLHEATFEDGMEGDAMAKKHSTTGEALGVALKMKAKNVVLTHFSQRYQKLPLLDNVRLPDEIKFEEGNPTEGAITGPVDEGDGDEETFKPDVPKTSTSNPQPTYTAPAVINSDKIALRKAAVAEMHICVAFDYMRVKVSEIKDMKRLFPAIEQMFEEQQRKADVERKQETERLEAEAAKKRADNETSRQLKQAKKAAAKAKDGVNGEIKHLSPSEKEKNAKKPQHSKMNGAMQLQRVDRRMAKRGFAGEVSHIETEEIHSTGTHQEPRSTVPPPNGSPTDVQETVLHDSPKRIRLSSDHGDAGSRPATMR